MSKHTPGPWRHTLGGTVLSESGKKIARTVPEDLGIAPRIANARLMAAAPELLAACEAAIAYDEALLGRAARGEVNLLDKGGGVATGDDLDKLYFDWQEKARAAIAKATETRTDEETSR